MIPLLLYFTGKWPRQGASAFLSRLDSSPCPVKFLQGVISRLCAPWRVWQAKGALSRYEGRNWHFPRFAAALFACGLKTAPPRIALANESPEKKPIGLANDALEFSVLGDGWVKLANYRDYPLQREIIGAGGVPVIEKYIQRVTKANATALANEHNGLFGKLTKLRRGAPILRRHTDRWEIAAKEGITLPGKKPVGLENSKLGTFAELSAREDGLYGLPIFDSEAQVAMERDGLKYFSPFWWLDHVALENGASVVEPTELISVALTNSPNFKDSPALWNAHEQNETETTMNKKLLALLIALMRKHNIALANEDETTVESAFPQIDAKLTAQVALENEKPTTLAKITALENEAKTEKDAHGQTRTALANETAHANELTVDLAIAEGRIAMSDRRSKLDTIKTAADRKALLNEAVKFKVTPVSLQEKRDPTTIDQAGATKAANRLVALGNELFTKGGYATSEDAYGAAKETEEGKKLAAQLEDYKAATKK